MRTPNAAQFFRVLSEHSVNGWLTTPSAIRSIRQDDPDLSESIEFRRNLSSLRNVFLVGEHCDVETITWLQRNLPSNVRISDSWWQTETGWPITAGCMGLQNGHLPRTGVVHNPGSAGLPVPGYNVQLKSNGSMEEDVDESDDLGKILIKLPLPPGTASTLWEDHEKFIELYFSKYPVSLPSQWFFNCNPQTKFSCFSATGCVTATRNPLTNQPGLSQ